ncbi:MAG: exo-alpha-sialidase [Planctomycetes bacterium]|nr:exo-alpha-sialidase [Planctomycetota bacterium]
MELETKLTEFALALIDQQKARIAVPPQRSSTGFWFGGGNMVEDADGQLYLVGRYRNFGDSRTGLGAGERGLELAIFRSDDGGQSWQKQVSFSKLELNVGDRDVLSIEGSALGITERGVELFVSTEKAGIDYPAEFQSFLKPGTGVWTIDRLQAPTIDELKNAVIETVLESTDPSVLHVKDPSVYTAPDGDLVLLYCTHPYCWSSSNTAYATRADRSDTLSESHLDFFPRGFAWDIAITRGTSILDVPRIGAFAHQQVSLLFYDGGEALRNLDEHDRAVKRPRGYSCEEIGGVAYFLGGDMSRVFRLSRHKPLFISPYGTGCSRYVDVLATSDGLYATWQQSQNDLSQPLVMNFLTKNDVGRLLV